MPLLETSGKQLVEEHAQRILPFGLCRVDKQDLAGGMLAHIAARVQRAERVIQIVKQNRMSRRPAEQARRSCQQQRCTGGFFAPHAVPDGLRERVLGLRDVLKIQILAPQHVLLLRGADIQTAFVDIRLHDRRDEHGDIKILVDRGADARGADRLIKRRQRQKQQLPPDDRGQRRAVGAAVAAEDDVVIICRRAGLRAFVGRGVGDHVAARDEINVSVRKQVPQPRKILRHGDIDGDLVREQIRVPLVGSRDGDDAPAQELGKRFLAP